MDYPNDMTKWVKEHYPTFSSEQKKQAEELMPELRQEKSMITTWTQEELDIIERIIYDVKERRDYYAEISPVCTKECEQELEFLEKLKSIRIYEA